MAAAQQYEFLIALLVAIGALETVARRLSLPPAAAFILGGGALAVIPGVPEFALDPELVLLVFLPPLLMSGGYFTAWTEFRANFGAIALLALGAVAFTTAVVGVVAHALAPGLPWAVCFALGAVVSPPDAVAAAAVLKRLSLPSRLTATLEGESLLNDASGLVLFRFAVAAALTGGFSWLDAGVSFVTLTFGGVALGAASGTLGLMLMKRLRDSDLGILVTLLVPTAAYVVGEKVHVSGVLAVVTAGIVVGRHQHGAMSAGMRVRAHAFWDVLTFLLESFLFILIGLSLRGVLDRLRAVPNATGSFLVPVAAVVGATIVARLVWTYATWASRRALRSIGVKSIEPPSLRTATVIGWAGMRGVVTLTAALSLPLALPGRDLVLVSAFAVILVTVLVQGTTLGPLIRALRLSGADELRSRRDDEARARASVARAQLLAVAQASRQEDGSELHPRLLERYTRAADLTVASIEEAAKHRVQRVDHHETVLGAVEAGREELLRLHREGKIHDEVLRSIEWELDLQQLASESRL